MFEGTLEFMTGKTVFRLRQFDAAGCLPDDDITAVEATEAIQ